MMVLGRIAAPFGVKGWVRIVPFGDDPLSWGAMPKWWIAPTAETPDEAWRSVSVHECRGHGDGVIARFDECADRSGAQALQGWFVAAPREAMPAPAEDEFYWGDLIGLRVDNLAGESLGVVEGLLSTGAHDVLRVVADDGERLIPFVAAYAVSVDLAKRVIRVDWQKDW
jgi:16S rRNA processing protein RimM